MPEKKGFRQRINHFVGRSRSNPPLPQDGTLDPGESVSGTSGPANVATSTTSSAINQSLSLASPGAAITPSGPQLPGEISPAVSPLNTTHSASPQSRFGLFPLTPAISEEQLRQGGIDFVAIHGITGDYERTWTHPQGALWLKDFLLNDLSGATGSALNRVFSFGYDAQVQFSVSKARLEDFARSLLQGLKRVRRGKDLQSRPLIFICHSMGGLVIKQAMVIARLDTNDYPGVQASTKGIVFLSTPHRGSGSTDWPTALAKALNAILIFAPSSIGTTRTDLLETLKSNSDELQTLATNFRNQATSIKIVSCYEMNATPPLKDLIVDRHTGTLDFPGETHIPMEGCNHSEVCRFPTNEDTNYQNILSEILNLVDHSSESVPKFRERVVEEVDKNAALEEMFAELPSSTDTFYGRDMELRRMEELLDPGKPGQKGVVLCGIGGSGKTQTTLRFINKHKEAYSAFIWINAFTTEATKQSFSEATDMLSSSWPSRDLPTTYTGPSNWKKVITRLRTTRYTRWLLVIDSVDNLNLENYTQYIPSCKHGSIIVTSTQIQASEVFRMPCLIVDSLDPQSSFRLLVAKVFGPTKEVDLSNTDRQCAASIVKELNGSPLAIEQAAVLLRKNVVSFPSFISNYKAQYRILMDQYPSRGYLVYDKERPVTTVFSMLCTFIRTDNPEAAILLTFIAVLGSWQIPMSFIEEFQFSQTKSTDMDDDAKTLRRILGNRVLLRLALSYLTDVCLVKLRYNEELSWKSFSVHRAISHWCVEVMTPEKRAWVVQAAYRFAMGIIILNESPNEWHNKEKAIMRGYLAPLDRCISLIQKYVPEEDVIPPNGKFCEEFTAITAQLAHAYLLEGRLEEAKVQFSTAIGYETTRRSDEWPKTERDLDLLYGFAVALQKLGDLESSEEAYSSAMALSEKLFGHIDERTVAISNGLKSLSERREVMLAHHKSAVIGATDGKLLENTERAQAWINAQVGLTTEAEPLDELVDEELSADLLRAAYNGNEGMVRLILGIQAINTNARDVNGRTAFSWAAGNGHDAVVKLLLETGKAEINSKDTGGWAPLSLAARYGHETIVKLLLETSKAEINSKNNDGWAPLLSAARYGHETIVKLLLETGKAEINSKNNAGWTPLLQAARYGHEAVVKLLLGTGKAEINSKNNGGRTSLLLAAGYGHEAVVKLLLGTGEAEINLNDNEGWTPLFRAAQDGHEIIVKLLLETGKAQINLRDNNGWTPLWWATKNGHEAVVKLLQSNTK